MEQEGAAALATCTLVLDEEMRPWFVAGRRAAGAGWLAAAPVEDMDLADSLKPCEELTATEDLLRG